MSRSAWAQAAALTMFACSVAQVSSAHAATDVVTIWYGTRSGASKLNWLRGDDACKPGDRDCNVCAMTVPEQFESVFGEGDAEWKTKPYTFDWERHYEPSGLTASDVFDDATWVQKKHMQGFVRTNHPEFPFAGSHSDNDTGGIFFVRQREDGSKYLRSIHAASDGHPSGMHTIGAYVAVAEEHAIRLFDVGRPDDSQDMRFAVDRGNESELAGGGLGLAKLHGGGHLLVVAPNGGRHDTRSRFYYLHSDVAKPTRVSLLGADNGSAWRDKLNEGRALPLQDDSWLPASENISLITECGTGDIYTIHSTGEPDALENATGSSGAIWRLSRVEWGGEGPHLVPVDHAEVKQSMDDCHLRSAASVHPDSDGRLVFYCHQRSAQDNLLGDQETFHFTVGTPYE